MIWILPWAGSTSPTATAESPSIRQWHGSIDGTDLTDIDGTLLFLKLSMMWILTPDFDSFTGAAGSESL